MDADDPVCLCGDAKSQHRLGRRGCKALDCGCSAFEAVEAPINLSTRIIAEARPKTHLEAVKGERDKAERGEQSTSAQLREVERELADVRNQLTEMAEMRAEAVARIREVAKQRGDALVRVTELEALLAHAEQYARDLQDNGDVAPIEIHGWDAWQCLTCGNRYRRDFQHEHALIPVRVSITER